MSFTSITTGEITSGQPVSNSTLTKVKNDFDDHETRIEALESFNSQDPPIILGVSGYYAVANGILKTTANFTFNIANVFILVDQAGSSGTLQIDIQKSRAGSAYSSIFTTPPSAVYTSGNDYLANNAVLNSGMVGVQAGDILRLDISSAQVSGKNFLVRIDYTR